MSSQEVNLVATFYPKPGKSDELIGLLKEITKIVHATEPDALIYYAMKVQGKDEIVFVEKYKDQATLDAHIKTPHFQEFAAKLPDLTDKPFDLKLGSYIAGFEGRPKI